MKTPNVVFQPATQYSIRDGINLMVDAIRPTLGPISRTTLIESMTDDLPEMLDNGGVIARRIIEIKNRDTNMGAMLTRHMIWAMHKSVGDGTATAAVIFQKIYSEGLHFLVNGGNRMLLRRYLEEGLPLILEGIDEQTRPLEGQEKITQLAQSICGDSDLSKLLGEIFDIVGAYGQLEIRESRGRAHEREYVEGIYWEGGLMSRVFLPDGVEALEFENPLILLTDFDLKNPNDMVAIFEKAQQRCTNRLIVLARSLSDNVTGYLYKVNHGDVDFKVAVVKIPFMKTGQRHTALMDMAFFSGGEVLTTESGATFASVRSEHFGQTRWARMNMHSISFTGGKGDARRLRSHITSLQRVYENTQDIEDRRHLLGRIGRLQGGAAVLYLGGTTKLEIENNKSLVERTAAALRPAIISGGVPGGGVVYLGCQERLKNAIRQDDPLEKRAAFRILDRAMEEPLRAIFANSGLEIEDWLGIVRQASPGIGVDVRTRQLVDMVDAGIIDSAAVAREVCHKAINTAALALTLDVLIHRSNPPKNTEP